MGGGPGGGGEGYGDWTYGLSKMYGDAIKDPKQAQALLLGSGGAGAMQASADAIDKQLAGLPAGHPARAQLEAQKAKLKSELPLQLAQGGQQLAIQGLTGFAPTNSSWLLGNRGLDVDLYKSNQQYDLGLKGNQLGWGQLGLGYADLGQRGTQFTQSLDWNKNQFGQQLGFDRWKAQGDWNSNKYAADKSAKSGLWSAVGNIVGRTASMLSDIRLKENIMPGRRGLSDLLKLKVYSYNYVPELDPTTKPTHGVMAQELEKVAPELVINTDTGYKAVDTYGLLAMTMAAVKELNKKVEKKK
jgi:hypothetical protein